VRCGMDVHQEEVRFALTTTKRYGTEAERHVCGAILHGETTGNPCSWIGSAPDETRIVRLRATDVIVEPTRCETA